MGITVLDEALMPIITHGDLSVLTREYCLQLMKSTFESVAEREIFTGDKVCYYIIDANEMQEGTF